MKKYELRSRFLARVVWGTLIVCGGFMFLPGCGSSDSADAEFLAADEGAAQFQEDYFKYAIDRLQQSEESGGAEMRQQVVDQLNQWVPSQKAPSNWLVDPMVKNLPDEIAPEGLDVLHFLTSDGYELQQAVWMRELARWTCGDSNDPIERGGLLFDWIVRNIQLEPMPADGLGDLPLRPWETLFFGRGTAVDRAMVFILAMRQEAIDAVMLMVPDKDRPDRLIPWAIGVMKDKEMYLFEPELGLPIPAKDGVSFVDGQLVVKPATLSQILDDPTLLEALDVSETKKYPITAEQIKQTVAMIPASAASLSARFALVESRMVGQQRAILTIHPTALAEEFQAVKGLSADRVRLWTRPFLVDKKRAELGPEAEKKLTLAMKPFLAGQESPLWKGRTAHIMGKLTGKASATSYYQMARISDRKLMEYEEMFLSDPSTSREAIDEGMAAFRRAKQDASYWLGLINYSRDDWKAAIDYFATRIISQEASYRHWLPGAYYNLARCCERIDRIEQAVKFYRMVQKNASTYGNELRAKWISAKPKSATAE